MTLVMISLTQLHVHIHAHTGICVHTHTHTYIHKNNRRFKNSIDNSIEYSEIKSGLQIEPHSYFLNIFQALSVKQNQSVVWFLGVGQTPHPDPLGVRLNSGSNRKAWKAKPARVMAEGSGSSLFL